MLEYPVKDIRGNMLFMKKGAAWAYYLIKEKSVGLFNQEQEDHMVFLLNKLAWQLKEYGEIDYKVIPVEMDISRKLDETASQYSGIYKEDGIYYAERAKEILKDEVKEAVEYRFFIGVPLRKSNIDEGVLPKIKDSFQELGGQIKKLAGYQINKVDDLIAARYQENEEEVFSILNAYSNAVRLDEQEIHYLLRNQFTRGQGRAEVGKSLYSLTEGIIDPSEKGFIRIEQLEKSSYCSFLPVSEFPIDMMYSRWANISQALSYPVEINIRAIYEGKDKDYKDTNKIKKRFRDQDEQLLEANEDEDTLVNNGRQLLFELENDIKNENKPILRTHVNYVVYGTSKKECKERVRHFKRVMKDNGAEIVQPIADQLILFYQSIPGAEIRANDWEQILTPEAFAESLFSVTRKIGNTAGFYLGKDISLPGESIENSKQLVFFNPFVARLGVEGSKYSSPHCTISGPTGMGKSYLLKNILLNSIFYGAKVLITDPKNEIEKQFKAIMQNDSRFSDIVNSFNYITFSSRKEDSGKLDPLTFLDGEEAYDTAVSILENLAELQSTERNVRTAILKAVRHVVTTEHKPGLLKVVRMLQNDENSEIRNLGNLLYEIGTNGIAKLLFSEGDTKGVKLSEQVNILQIQNLSLPEQGVKAATRDEHIAVTLMIPLAKFATKFARDDKQIKLTIFEEAWMLTNTGQGDRLIKEMLRTGRSLKSSVFLVTQSIIDYNKADIKENIGTKFAFKAKTAEEAGHIIEYLGLEDNKANRDMLKNLTEGQCIMEDIYGRTAKIQADVLFNEWVHAFNTKADETKTAELEEAFI